MQQTTTPSEGDDAGDAHARDRRARALVDRGELLAAFDEWAVALQLEPGHVGAIKGMAFIRFQQGMLEESERLLLQAQERGGDATISAAINTVRSSASPRHSGGMFQSFVSDIATAVGSHLSAMEGRAVASEAPHLRVSRNYFMDHEKVVWHWPDIGARIAEDVR